MQRTWRQADWTIASPNRPSWGKSWARPCIVYYTFTFWNEHWFAVTQRIVNIIKNAKITLLWAYNSSWTTKWSDTRRSVGRGRARSRHRTTWTANIFEWTSLIYSEAVRNAERRTEWRVVASNPLAEDGTWWWNLPSLWGFQTEGSFLPSNLPLSGWVNELIPNVWE